MISWSKLEWDSGITKNCTKCGDRKPADSNHFPKHSMGRFGLRGYCFACWKIHTFEYINKPEVKKHRKNIQKEYIKSGKNAKRSRIWRKNNQDSCLKSRRKWIAKNKDHIRKQQQEYRNANRDKIREKQRRVDARLQKNPTHVLKKRMKARLRKMIKGISIGSSEKIFGYTYSELKKHIEKQFKKGMSWDSLMNGEIHIDHKIPISSFNIKSIDDQDFKKCWGLENLQPLWAKDNYLKGSKIE